MKTIRATLKLIRLTWILTWSALEYGVMIHRGNREPARLRARRLRWGSRVAVRLVDLFDLKITVTGKCPVQGCLVSNHLGYLDIFVFYSLIPLVFVAKSEIESWPVFGWFATWGGSNYIRRQQAKDVLRVAAGIRELLEAGLPVAFFPEATSSRGDGVLPFRSSLLEVLTDGKYPVTAAAISYPGNPQASYAGDDTLIFHLWKMLHAPSINVHVRFSPPMLYYSDRKQIARSLHNEVTRLLDGASYEGLWQGSPSGR